MSNPVKSIGYIKCHNLSSPRPVKSPSNYIRYLLKALTIISDTTVRRTAVDQEDLKAYWKSEKRSHFSR